MVMLKNVIEWLYLINLRSMLRTLFEVEHGFGYTLQSNARLRRVSDTVRYALSTVHLLYAF